MHGGFVALLAVFLLSFLTLSVSPPLRSHVGSLLSSSSFSWLSFPSLSPAISRSSRLFSSARPLCSPSRRHSSASFCCHSSSAFGVSFILWLLLFSQLFFDAIRPFHDGAHFAVLPSSQQPECLFLLLVALPLFCRSFSSGSDVAG